MSSPKQDEYLDLIGKLPKHRAAFEMQVEAVCAEVAHIAKDIASAIGEVSVDEAKQAIIEEFTKRLKELVIIG